MSNPDDPNRLWRTAKAGSALQRSLAAVRDRGPTEDQLRALESKVLAAVAVAGATGAAATATAAAAKAAVASPVALAGAGLGATKLAVVLLVAVATSGTAVGLFWSARPTATTVSSGQASPARPTAPRSPPPVSAPLPAATPGVTLTPEPTPAQPLAAPLAPAPAARAAVPTAPRDTPVRPVARALAPAAGAPARPAGQLDEIQLLSRARRALANDPGLALALADQHRRRFASGSMDQEREVIAVHALVSLGRLADARGRAQLFAREHPGSVYVGRMREILSRGAAGDTP